jgi:hypothetical protein
MIKAAFNAVPKHSLVFLGKNGWNTHKRIGKPKSNLVGRWRDWKL